MKNNFYLEKLGVKFNKGEYEYKQDQLNNSSTIALASILGVDYNTAFDYQLKTAYELKQVNCNDYIVLEHILVNNGFQKINLKGNISVREFMYNYKSGKYIITLSNKYIIAYIDGVWSGEASLSNEDINSILCDIKIISIFYVPNNDEDIITINNERNNMHCFITNYILGIDTCIHNIEYNDKFNNKRKDCSTRTLSKLLDINYYEILKMQLNKALDYGTIHANYLPIVEDILKEYNYYRLYIEENKITVGEFMYTNKHGKYAICSNGHIIAYIDGIWYDNESMLKYSDQFILSNIYRVYALK